MSKLLESFAAITGPDVVNHLRQLAESLHGAKVIHVNSPRIGGGVAEILDVIDDRLDESETSHWIPAARQFEFLRSQLVIFDTHRRMEKPADLAEQIPKMSTSSIFYHFIDARSRIPEPTDDFRFWLTGFGAEYDALCAQLAAIDPFFSSLSQIRQELAELFTTYFRGGAA